MWRRKVKKMKVRKEHIARLQGFCSKMSCRNVQMHTL